MTYLRFLLCGLLAAVLIAAAPPKAKGNWIKCLDGSIVKRGTGCVTEPDDPPPPPPPVEPPPPTGQIQYQSILGSNGLSPAIINAFGRDWRNYLISDEVAGRDYALKLSADRRYGRFEYRPGDMNAVMGDALGTSRAELGGNRYGSPTRLPNGQVLWGAMSFIIHPWSDPVGMVSKSGGVHGQIHMGSTAGGSPAISFRMTDDFKYKVKTVGQYDSDGTTRFEKAIAAGVPHDLVYKVVLKPQGGSAEVWLDGVKIVSAMNISIGHSNAESYYNIGAYFAGGVTCNVVFEVGHHVDPKPGIDLSARITSPPVWGS